MKREKRFSRFTDFVIAANRANLSMIIMNIGKTDGQDQ